jgi:glycosyltransferase involved in cell wall biosynthesis
VQRTLKFAKYLARDGWRPIVWSADYVPQLPVDTTLLDDLPAEVEHHHTPTWDPTRRIERIMAPLKKRMRHRPVLLSKIDGIEWRLGRFARWIMARSVPDDQVIWAMRSYPHLRRIVRRERVQAIYSTFSPASNHLLAWKLKRATGLPWVADFRDLWTDDCRYAGRWWWRRLLDRRLETRFLRNADIVLATSDEQRDILSARVPAGRAKFHTITNGVDFEDFARLRAEGKAGEDKTNRDKFNLTYVGQLRESQAIEDCFEGILRFLNRYPRHRKRFAFRVVGQISARLRKRAADLGLPMTATGYLRHDQALREMLRADLLLLPSLVGGHAAAVIPGKVFEYLGSGRPILLIGEDDSTAARFVERLGGGICVPADADAIAAALRTLWFAWREGALPGGCDRSLLADYGRDALARRLERLLKQLVDPAGAPTSVSARGVRYEDASGVGASTEVDRRIKVAT